MSRPPPRPRSLALLRQGESEGMLKGWLGGTRFTVIRSIFTLLKVVCLYIFLSLVSNVVTKRFIFDASNIARVREKVVVESPTRDKAISAITWKRFIELDQSRLWTTTTDRKHPYSALYTVNLRMRRAHAAPPLQKHGFWNMSWKKKTDENSQNAVWDAIGYPLENDECHIKINIKIHKSYLYEST
ncbi:hypothetical protein Scep_022171 [Stephania cephalantha]|uniref:Uncharacterized protein n=1 Tax=Stephania cephalantha TaxID=152367 RepID=A0AAP0I0S3_9MAGN